MTSYNPRLSVKRLIVKQGGAEAYNASFHAGLNIIRGENSSGKSTVLDFLFYGLGGDLTDWREASLSCSEVLVEVELNGLPAVLAREVSESSGRPMRIFFGSINDALANPTGWSIHNYRRSATSESFSQVLFRLLGMPEATGDANSNVTMHQMLRLLYADQLSPVDRIFRFERFDTALTRQTVGDLLCGAYDNSLYRDQLRLREADKEHVNATTEWRNALAAFAGSSHPVSSDWINAERSLIQSRLEEVRAQAAALEEQIFSAEVSEGLSLEEQHRAYAELSEAQRHLLQLKSDKDALQLEIADSNTFIESLETKLDQLQQSKVAAEALKTIAFKYCPSCLAPVKESKDDHACSLCHTSFDEERAQGRVLAIINETGVQLKQSRQIQASRIEQGQRLDEEYSAASRKWHSLAERYRLLNRLPSTELRTRARELYGQAGYLERQLEDLGDKASLIERIEALSRARAALSEEISSLKDRIETGERSQQDQLRRAYTRISDNTAKLLRQDLLRQDTFAKASSISFSFGDDRLAVNGESFFSASSMVYLRNSFFAGFFEASLQDQSFRHPRFLMLDTIEDKGMEPERSHHFQELLAAMSEESDTDHQLIYATAMISPMLENSPHVVDRFYTHEQRTLRLR